MRLRPGALLPDTAVAQQQLRQAVPAAHQVAADLLARTRQIARGLMAFCRDRDRRQCAGHQLAQQMLGVLAVVLDLVTARARRLAGRDHLTAHSRLRRHAVQPEAGRTRLIAGVYRRRQPDQPLNDRLDPTRAKAPSDQLAGLHIQRRGMRRARMDIHRRPCHRSVHGRTLLRMGSAGAHLRPDKPPQNANWVRPSTSRLKSLHRV